MKGYVLASKYLVNYRMRVGYMYRETPTEKDSGWRFFAGSETDEYLADPTHIGTYDLETILTLDPSVKPYLTAVPGVAFTRIVGTNHFEAEKMRNEESIRTFGYVIASKMLVDNRLPVKYMYREPAEGEDSGWRFFCGDEDQAYVDNADNLAIYDIHTILSIDRSIEPYLQEEPVVGFERDDAEELFQRIEDFSLEVDDE